MFTQKISMDCTYEQYKKYLKDELGKMGYCVYYADGCTNGRYIANNYTNNSGEIGVFPDRGKDDFGRTYLGKFNAPLFLALAAMTDKPEGGYRELWIEDVTIIMPVPIFKPSWAIRCDAFQRSRKATVEEIMEKFGDKKEQSLEDALQKASNYFVYEWETKENIIKGKVMEEKNCLNCKNVSIQGMVFECTKNNLDINKPQIHSCDMHEEKNIVYDYIVQRLELVKSGVSVTLTDKTRQCHYEFILDMGYADKLKIGDPFKISFS